MLLNTPQGMELLLTVKEASVRNVNGATYFGPVLSLCSYCPCLGPLGGTLLAREHCFIV